MKITPPSLNTPSLGTVPGPRPDSAAGVAASVPSATKGPVDLSAAARHLSNLQNGDNDIDIERIDRIKAAIASGQLSIDTSRVADELIASVRDLLR